ncbi:MAG: uroporphyrinogen-III synthase [Bacillaceae bacterium]|nr:uroporphyrinogen-III synthase [Bacillaceae bacterium]
MTLPLEGKRILITRGKKQSASISRKIQQNGGIPVAVPLLAFEPFRDSNNQNILQSLDEYDWIVFTSANGVKFFFESLTFYNISPEALSHIKVASIGSKTTEALASFQVSADFQPGTFQADVFGPEFLQRHHPDHVLFVRGNLSRPVIPEFFKKNSVSYTPITVYRTVVNIKARDLLQQELKKEQLDVLTFASPSAVDAFFELGDSFITEMHLHTLCLCIGPTTKEKAAERGFKKILIPDEYIASGMIQKLVQYFQEEG